MRGQGGRGCQTLRGETSVSVAGNPGLPARASSPFLRSSVFNPLPPPPPFSPSQKRTKNDPLTDGADRSLSSGAMSLDVNTARTSPRSPVALTLPVPPDVSRYFT